MTHLVVTEIKEGFWDNIELVHSEEELKNAVQNARAIAETIDYGRGNVFLSIFDINLVKQYKFPGVSNGKTVGTED